MTTKTHKLGDNEFVPLDMDKIQTIDDLKLLVAAIASNGSKGNSVTMDLSRPIDSLVKFLPDYVDVSSAD